MATVQLGSMSYCAIQVASFEPMMNILSFDPRVVKDVAVRLTKYMHRRPQSLVCPIIRKYNPESAPGIVDNTCSSDRVQYEVRILSASGNDHINRRYAIAG